MENKCLNEEMLADFLEGRLQDEDLDRAERHLADCDRCLDMIKIGGGLVRGGEMTGTRPAPDEVTEAAVKRVVLEQERRGQAPSAAARVGHSIKEMSAKVAGWFTPEFMGRRQLAPVRGDWQIVSDTVIQVKKKFRSFQIGIEIEKVGDDTATIRVTMLSEEKEGRQTRVTLKKEKREVSSDVLNGKLVVFESIPFGRYSLVFSSQGKPIGNYEFEIKETLNES